MCGNTGVVGLLEVGLGSQFTFTDEGKLLSPGVSGVFERERERRQVHLMLTKSTFLMLNSLLTTAMVCIDCSVMSLLS